MNSSEHYLSNAIFYSTLLPIFFLTIALIIGWIIYFIVKCWRIYKEYKTCKRTPVLHPLYSDVQYLSKQRKLYNLKTHFTKYILMIVCSLVEVSSICVAYSASIRLKPNHLLNNSLVKIGNVYCKSLGWDENGHVIPIQTNVYLLFLLHLVLVTILTRYLAARYLYHPFKRTLIKYIIWYSLQFISIELCSTIYTWVFMVLIFPIISLTNWILLLRATSILSRVLRSHLMDIKLYSNNRVFYNTQLSAYNFYRKFRIMCLVSALFSIVICTGFLVIRMAKIVFVNFCSIHFGHTMIPLFLKINYSHLIRNIINKAFGFCIYAYLLSLFLPLCGLTFAPLIIKCVKRCREKEDQYRYNYEKLEPLLRRRRN